MYESPIEKIYGDIQSQIVKHDEERLIYSVNQAVDYNVDKDELLKALQYDRNQYQKGYNDAKSEYYKIGHWIKNDFSGLLKCSSCDNDAPISTCSGEQYESHYCQTCGAKMIEVKADEVRK